MPQEDYNQLIKKAASKNATARKFSLLEEKKAAYAIIDKWHKGK